MFPQKIKWSGKNFPYLFLSSAMYLDRESSEILCWYLKAKVGLLVWINTPVFHHLAWYSKANSIPVHKEQMKLC